MLGFLFFFKKKNIMKRKKIFFFFFFLLDIAFANYGSLLIMILIKLLLFLRIQSMNLNFLFIFKIVLIIIEIMKFVWFDLHLLRFLHQVFYAFLQKFIFNENEKIQSIIFSTDQK